MSSAYSSALWFLAIVALIPAALWLLKRTPLGGGTIGAGGAGTPRHVGALALSPSQRIVTVEVGEGESRRWLVLGVTAQQITTLHEMPPQAEPPVADAAAPSFAQLLGRLGRTPGASHGR